MLVINFLIGLLVILGTLFIVGITRGNRISQKTWVILWSVVSVAFVCFLVASAFIDNENMLNFALGGSVGYVIAVTIHTIHHAIEEVGKKGKQKLNTKFP
jgi:uncharacterized membrane protein YqgA involved in biofilm formation